MGIHTVFTSAYHPQTDGQTERTHRTLEQCIRCLFPEGSLDDSEWCSVLPHVEFAINNSPSTSTHVALPELVFGTRLWQPLDIVT